MSQRLEPNSYGGGNEGCHAHFNVFPDLPWETTAIGYSEADLTGYETLIFDAATSIGVLYRLLDEHHIQGYASPQQWFQLLAKFRENGLDIAPDARHATARLKFEPAETRTIRGQLALSSPPLRRVPCDAVMCNGNHHLDIVGWYSRTNSRKL